MKRWNSKAITIANDKANDIQREQYNKKHYIESEERKKNNVDSNMRIKFHKELEEKVREEDKKDGTEEEKKERLFEYFSNIEEYKTLKPFLKSLISDAFERLKREKQGKSYIRPGTGWDR